MHIERVILVQPPSRYWLTKSQCATATITLFQSRGVGREYRARCLDRGGGRRENATSARGPALLFRAIAGSEQAM
jgi:hypothetical protein